MEAHSHHGADVRGTRASGPEVSGSLAEVFLLTSGQPSPMPALDPLQSALLASASDVSLQTLPSCPATTMVVSDKRLFLDICAGATRPMFQAAWQAGMQVLSVAPLCASQLDWFNYSRYEQLLKLSFSGAVWLACVSPPCGDFSTIKLRPGPGPKPIRTSEYPVSFSQRKCFSAGPPAAKLVPFGTFSIYLIGSLPSWGPYQPGAAPECFVLAAVHGATLFVAGWRFLLLYRCLCFWHERSQTLAVCYIFCRPQRFGMRLRHERSAHVDEAGKRLADGTYLSHGTAGYPSSLATEFMRTVQLLNDTTEPCYCALHDAIQLVPPKDLDALPIAFQDSGGMGSIPHWSCPSQCKDNLLPSLRRWLGMLPELGFPWRLRSHTCPFSDSEIFSFRESFETLQSQKRISPTSWDVPFGQPCGPDALHSLSRSISNQNVALFPSLSVGVLTGYHHDMPASSVFATRHGDVQPKDKLQICEANWSGAGADPTLLLTLVRSEVDAVYLVEFPLAQALETWGKQVSVGNINIVHSDDRKPRLVVDDSIRNTNALCHINETYSSPSPATVRAAFPLRGGPRTLGAFYMDVKLLEVFDITASLGITFSVCFGVRLS